jgi:hypothetical protein
MARKRNGRGETEVSAVPAQPSPAELADRMETAFRMRAMSVGEFYDRQVSEFLKQAEFDPIYAIQSSTVKLVIAYGEKQAWNKAVDVLDQHEGTLRLRLHAVVEAAIEAVFHMAKFRFWGQNSTSTIANAMNMHEVAAASRGWTEVRDMALRMIKEMDEAVANHEGD